MVSEIADRSTSSKTNSNKFYGHTLSREKNAGAHKHTHHTQIANDDDAGMLNRFTKTDKSHSSKKSVSKKKERKNEKKQCGIQNVRIKA